MACIFTFAHHGSAIGGMTLQADGSLLLFMAEGAVAFWRDGKLTPFIESLPGETGNRFNDVIADTAGRVFCGTMPTPSRLGNLYRLDTDPDAIFGSMLCIAT